MTQKEKAEFRFQIIVNQLGLTKEEARRRIAIYENAKAQAIEPECECGCGGRYVTLEQYIQGHNILLDLHQKGI